MKALRNFLDKLLNFLGGTSLAVMTILTTYQVITRYIFNAPSTWSEELVGYMFAWSTMFGTAVITGERGHMNIPVIIDLLSPAVKKGFHLFAEIIGLVFSASILVFGGFQVSALAMGQMTSSLGVPVGTFYWVLPVCGALMVIYSILNIIDITKGDSEAALDEVAAAIAKAEADRAEAEAAAKKEA